VGQVAAALASLVGLCADRSPTSPLKHMLALELEIVRLREREALVISEAKAAAATASIAVVVNIASDLAGRFGRLNGQISFAWQSPRSETCIPAPGCGLWAPLACGHCSRPRESSTGSVDSGRQGVDSGRRSGKAGRRKSAACRVIPWTLGAVL
jgi:hypothetical protein